MKNIFKMEFFRLFRSSLWWLMLLIAVIASAINDLAIQFVMEFAQAFIGGEPGTIISYEDAIMSLTLKNSNVLIVIVLFALIYINGLYRNGLHKSLTGIIQPLYRVYIVDYVIQLLFILTTVILSAGVTIIIFLAFGNVSFTGNINHVLMFYGAYFIAVSGIVALINFLFYLLTPKRFVGALILGLVLVLIVVPLGGQIIDIIIARFSSDPNNAFQITDYLNTANLTFIITTNDSSIEPLKFYGKMMIIGGIEMVTGIGLSILLTTKRDLV